MIDWLGEFIDDIRNQEIAVNSTKTGAAALGVVSASGLFTPFAPLAIGGLVAAGGAGVVTTIGDLIANKVKGGNLETKVDNMKAEDSKLQDLQRELNEQAAILAKELNVSKDDAILFLLVGVPKMVAQASTQVVNGLVQIGRILPHLRAINDAMRLGASFSQAVALSNTVFQGGRLTIAAGVEGAAMAGTTLAVTTAAKALGGLGAVVGVADAIYSWSTKNPNRKSAEDLLPNLKENLKSLKDTKERFLQIQKM